MRMRAPHPSLPTSFFLVKNRTDWIDVENLQLFTHSHWFVQQFKFFKVKTPLMTFIYYSQEFNYPFPSKYSSKNLGKRKNVAISKKTNSCFSFSSSAFFGNIEGIPLLWWNSLLITGWTHKKNWRQSVHSRSFRQHPTNESVMCLWTLGNERAWFSAVIAFFQAQRSSKIYGLLTKLVRSR